MPWNLYRIVLFYFVSFVHFVTANILVNMGNKNMKSNKGKAWWDCKLWYMIDSIYLKQIAGIGRRTIYDKKLERDKTKYS